ncbi:MAG: hypothetical protein RXQ77_03945 [Candidatus Nanopusillus sp.]
MSNLYKEYKWSELIKNEIRRYGHNIGENSYLAKLLEIANKNEKRNPKVYVIDRSLLREIIKCVLTGEYKIQNQQTSLEYCINKYAPGLSEDIKRIVKEISEYGIPLEEFFLNNPSARKLLLPPAKTFYLLDSSILHKISIKGTDLLDSIIDLYTQNIPTAESYYSSPAIVVVRDGPFNIFNPLLATLIHEYIHLTELHNYIWGNIEGKKNINLYDIIDKYIRPSNSLYKGYENKEFAKHEIITELGTIYILEDVDMKDLSLDRMYFIKSKLDEIGEIKEKVGIGKIPRERMILSYLTAHYMHELADKNENMKKILKDINEAINEELRLYVERELKK